MKKLKFFDAFFRIFHFHVLDFSASKSKYIFLYNEISIPGLIERKLG